MPNDYFQFKQFTVYQNNVAMKVGTDGVLLGAWSDIGNAMRILDIGTGTGLLALMVAQRNQQAIIDAVEIDVDAYKQAEININTSPWGGRIHIYNQSFQEFSANCALQYDIIISNPPYFNNSFKSPKHQRSIARHSDDLPYADLIRGTKKLLKSDGKLTIILPVKEGEIFIKLALDNQLYCSKKLNVKPDDSKPIIRLLLEFIPHTTTTVEHTICIETNGRHNYSEEYKTLTKDFYLKF